jgi:hypothetical protein
MVVYRTWRSPGRRSLVDEIIDEPGVRFRIWDAEGAPVAEFVDDGQLGRLPDDLDVDPDDLQQVPITDQWCKQQARYQHNVKITVRLPAIWSHLTLDESVTAGP